MRHPKLLPFVFLMAFSTGALSQSTIVSTISGGYGFAEFTDGNGGIYAVSAGWTQTGSYGNVSIAADLNGGGYPQAGTATDTAYLMTQIGVGTDNTSEVASSVVTATSAGYPPDLVTLFSGLTLGAGTYYIVIVGSAGGWEVAQLVATTQTAPGVTDLTYWDSYPNNRDATFAPGSDFATLAPPESSHQLEYAVTGTMVPENDPAILLGGGIIVVACLCRKNFRATTLCDGH